MSDSDPESDVSNLRDCRKEQSHVEFTKTYYSYDIILIIWAIVMLDYMVLDLRKLYFVSLKNKNVNAINIFILF